MALSCAFEAKQVLRTAAATKHACCSSMSPEVKRLSARLLVWLPYICYVLDVACCAGWGICQRTVCCRQLLCRGWHASPGAGRLEGQSLWGVCRRPREVGSARANMMAALDALGMLGHSAEAVGHADAWQPSLGLIREVERMLQVNTLSSCALLPGLTWLLCTAHCC